MFKNTSYARMFQRKEGGEEASMTWFLSRLINIIGFLMLKILQCSHMKCNMNIICCNSTSSTICLINIKWADLDILMALIILSTRTGLFSRQYMLEFNHQTMWSHDSWIGLGYFIITCSYFIIHISDHVLLSSNQKTYVSLAIWAQTDALLFSSCCKIVMPTSYFHA